MAKWTKEEIDVIKANPNLTPKEIYDLKLIPNRSLLAIDGKKQKLGLDNYKFRWSKEEDDKLKEYYLKYTAKEIAQVMPNRTVNAINQRCTKLGLSLDKSVRTNPKINQVYGRPTIISDPFAENGHRQQIKAMCECGAFVIVNVCDLKSGNTKSCGCLNADMSKQRHAKNTKINIGDKFGKWTVISNRKVSKTLKNVSYGEVICECECGQRAAIAICTLLSNASRACGSRTCRDWESTITHGGTHTRLYRIWAGIKQRCKPDGGKWYGNKGIRMYDDWSNSFEAFREWAISNGYNDTLTIDRRNNALGYFPDNCRWSTYSEQANNKSNNRLLTCYGETKTIMQWAQDYRCKVSKYTFRGRIYSGWSIEEALITPIKFNNKIT